MQEQKYRFRSGEKHSSRRLSYLHSLFCNRIGPVNVNDQQRSLNGAYLPPNSSPFTSLHLSQIPRLSPKYPLIACDSYLHFLKLASPFFFGKQSPHAVFSRLMLLSENKQTFLSLSLAHTRPKAVPRRIGFQEV